MNYISAIVMMILLCACGSDTKKQVPVNKKDSLVVKADTLYGRDIDLHPSIQDGFVLDTIHIKGNLHHTGIFIVQPVGIEEDYPWAFGELSHIQQHRIKEFLDNVAEDATFLEDGILKGFSMSIYPISLYETDSVMSVIMEMYRSSSFGPGTFTFNTINFDGRTGHLIRLRDYFMLDTPADSDALWKTLSAAINSRYAAEANQYWRLYGPGEFAFDKANIYFCFEKGNLFYSGVLSIRKKVIEDLIRKQYR